MAEYIEREAVLKFIKDGLNNPDKAKAFGHDAIEIMAEVQHAPAADVVEVVRCKDCIYYNAEFEHMRELYHKTLAELEYYKNMETELFSLRAKMDVVYLIFGGKQ